MDALPAITDLLGGNLILFVLVLTRMGVMMMAMPAIGDGVPMRVRGILAVALTMVLMPLLEAPSTLSIDNLIEFVIAAVREAGIGLLLGLVVRLLVTGIQLVGELASSSGGLQMGDSLDPATRSSVPSLSRLVGLLVTAVMISVGGHRMMIEALLDSFRALPAGHVRFEIGMLELVVFELGSGVIAGIRTGGPLVAALLLSNLVTGLVSRTLPQLNILAIGLPVNALTLLSVACMTLGGTAWIFQDELMLTFERLQGLW